MRGWSSNLHSVKLRVEAMQEELSMVTNTYSVTEELPPPSAVHGETIRKTKFELKRSIKLKRFN